jgi:hypothetical protein
VAHNRFAILVEDYDAGAEALNSPGRHHVVAPDLEQICCGLLLPDRAELSVHSVQGRSFYVESD